MSWTQVEAGPEHRRELTGFDVVGVVRVTIPVIVEKATVRCLETQPWSLLQEFTARAISEVGGFRDARQVAEALGLKREAFIAPVLDDFMAQGLVVRASNGELHATSRFAEVVRERCTARSVSKTVVAIFEPVSKTRRSMGKEDKGRLTACAAAVSPAASIEEEFASWVGSALGPLGDQRVDSCRLEESKCGQGIACDVVAYVDPQRQQWGWEVLDPRSGKASQELRPACEALGVEGEVEELLRRQAGVEEVPSVVADSELTARVAELEAQLAESSKRSQRDRLERLLTRDARKRLKDLIRNAKSEVVLRFPWIKAAATEELLPDLQVAVRRGACVVIGYGICQRASEEESEDRAVAAIEALRSASGDNVATVVWLGNSHAKEAVIDRRHYLGGSFNMLSFRGDPDRQSGQIRQEVMMYTDRQEFVEAESRKICDEFRARLMHRCVTSGRADVRDLTGWCVRWQALAQIGMPTEMVRSALAEFPASDSRFDRPCALIVRGLLPAGRSGLQAEVGATVRQWLQTRCDAVASIPRGVRRQIATSLDDLAKVAEHTAPEFFEGWGPLIERLRS